MSFTDKLNFIKSSMTFHSVEILFFTRYVVTNFNLYFNIVEETDVNNLRTKLLKYNVKKVENIETEKEKILKMYENFVNFDETKKLFSITNISEFLEKHSDVKSLHKNKEQTQTYYKTKNVIKFLLKFDDNKSNFKSKKNETIKTLYDVVNFETTYNLIRNLNVLNELREICLLSITDEKEREVFIENTIFYFSSEMLQKDFNDIDNEDVKECKKLYKQEFTEVQKDKENFSQYVNEMKNLTFLEQINEIVRKNFKIENSVSVLNYINENVETLLV